MRIKEAINMAKDGMTLKEVLAGLDISYEQYREELKGVSRKQIETLQRLLARNARYLAKKDGERSSSRDNTYPLKVTTDKQKIAGKIMEKAYFGETKQSILAKLDMDEKTYKTVIQKLTKEQRKKLHRWLIVNAKIAKKDETSKEVTASEATCLAECKTNNVKEVVRKKEETYVIEKRTNKNNIKSDIEKSKVTDILDMANKGLTKQAILNELQIDDKTYKEEIAQLSESKKKELHYLLINNAKKNKLSEVNTKEANSQSTSTTINEIHKQEEQIAKGDVVNILDTSYLSCSECRFEKIKDAVILPKVFEQITVAYRNGSKRMCKLFYMLLEEKVDIALVGETITVDFCPEGEDYADMEILAYAQKIAESGKIPVVYTADKALALYCKQKGIKYYFVYLAK